MILHNQKGHEFGFSYFKQISIYGSFICNKCGTEFITMFDKKSSKTKFKHFEDGIMGNIEIDGEDLESYIKNELIYCNDLIIKNIIE